MESFIRIAGWGVGIGYLALFAWGLGLAIGWDVSAGWHLRAGLGLMMLFLLVHTLPYFSLTGSVGRLEQMAGDDDGRRRVQLAVGLKSGLFLPSLAVVLAGIAAPIIAFAQMVEGLPPWTHGAFMGGLAYFHVRVWAKALFALRMVAELTVDARQA